MLLVLSSENVRAAINYGTIDSTLTQNFDDLPTDFPTNGSIQGTTPVYSSGWKDDSSTVPGVSVGLPGWYLWHPVMPSSENGTNGHQRFRAGTGQNTGAFWAFGSAGSDPDKALGSIGSTTVAGNGDPMYIGLQLINTTGQTLHGFQLTFDGEQWRDGQSTSAETLLFDYSLTANNMTWNQTTTSFTAVPTLNFVAPTTAGTGSSGTAIDGNTLASLGGGRVPDITSTVTGISWAPGAELWLRWSDPQLASLADDGMAIDNVRFVAGNSFVNTHDITSIASGLASASTTWSNHQPPSSDNTYRVVSGNTVSVDAPFAGAELRANAGGTVNFGNAGSGQSVPSLVVDAGGSLTKTATGDFALGDANAAAMNTLQLDNTTPISMTIDANSNFHLDMKVSGAGELNFSSGNNSQLWLSSTDNHLGAIRFNGSGSQVNVTGSNGGFGNNSGTAGSLEMNSTGANILNLNSSVSETGTVVFNQPGQIIHASSTDRLQGMAVLKANATVTVDLTQTYPLDERRLLAGNSAGTGLQGSGNITVNGTSFNPTDGFGVTLNEFEVGSTGEPGTLAVDNYTGTFTANDFVNVEIRHSEPGAKFVVNNNARLEMGHQGTAANPIPTHTDMAMGEVVVNNGGILEVGFEQNVAGDAFPEGHTPYHLNLVKTSGQNGGLTLNSGGTLRMQVNGTAANLFDSISAQGNVALGGTLEVLVNPIASTGSGTDIADLPNYTPTLGDTINIITLNPLGDFNNSGTVDANDLTAWKTAFGQNAGGDADKDGDTDGNDFLIWQRSVGTTGTISGNFANISIIDPTNTMLSQGLTFQVVKTATAVQLKVVSALAAVPEPSSVGLLAVGLGLALVRGRRGSSV
jgi:hypothetical protein